MRRNWGVHDSAQISGLGDDLWLLNCHSTAAVDRILALNRIWYGASKIFLDRWTPSAGRTEVIGQHMMWIQARGIPLHLRSEDLFRQIGDRCGGYIDHDSLNCLLNSIRIKVRTTPACPDQIALLFQDHSFLIQISKEAPFLLDSTCPVLVDKGKAIHSESKRGRVWGSRGEGGRQWREVGGSSSSTVSEKGGGGASNEGEVDSSGVVLQPDLEVLGVELASVTGGTFSTGFTPSRKQEEAVGASSTSGFAATQVPRTAHASLFATPISLSKGDGTSLCLQQRPPFDVSHEWGDVTRALKVKKTFWFLAGIGFREVCDLFTYVSKSSDAQIKNLFCLLSSQAQIPLSPLVRPAGYLIGLTRILLPSSLHCSAPLGLLPQLANCSGPAVSFDEVVVVAPSVESDQGTIVSPPLSSISEVESILKAVNSVAGIIGLQLEEEKEAAVRAVRATALEVIGRRRPAPKRTRTERELIKLGSALNNQVLVPIRKSSSKYAVSSLVLGDD
ncbi:hypothetical protein LINPERPRIM_LOCUS7951 [Linum perenne]